jgi:hypothetical protein
MLLLSQDKPFDQTVWYTLNSQGYRCPEWIDINWENCHLLLGCSVVQGVGLDDWNTLDKELSKLLNEPVINLGVGGGSLQFILANTYKLIDAGIRPKSVILVEPEPTRVPLFFKNKTEHLGSWILEGVHSSTNPNFLWYRQWVKDKNAETYGLLASRSIKTAWEHAEIPFFNTFQPYCPGDADLPKYVDVAKDGQHPGPRTIKLWAEHIANKKARLSELLG